MDSSSDAADRVLDYVYAHWKGSPKRPTLNEKEMKSANVMLEMLNSLNEGDVDLISEEYLNQFEDDTKDLSWTPEDEEYHKIAVFPDVIKTPGQPNMVQFSRGVLVEQEKVEKAVEYYGSKKGFLNNGSRVRPSLQTMMSRYKFIKNNDHLVKLRGFEDTGYIKANRRNNLEIISTELEKDVRTYIEEGRILHDSSLRFLITDIIRRNHLDIKDFKASHEWLAGWKRRHGLTSRKITKFVAIVRHKSRAEIEKQSKEFVAKVNPDFRLYSPANIFNCDQSGFQIEMHSARTLTFKGVKDVPCVVQCASSVTHSYTVMPIVSADGKLFEKLYINLKEPNGQFPATKGHFKANNIVVTCHTSHIMTKNLMKVFFEKVYFDPKMPKNSVLLVDSWTSWRDKTAIDSVRPATNNVKIHIIPPGSTGQIQPCDVGIFGAFKKVIKTITGHAQLTRGDHKVHQRDAILRLLSIVWHQLQHPDLQGWVQYAWHASGYDVPRPAPFKTPAQLFFPRDVARDCGSPGCPITSFFFCRWCEDYFCYDHLVIEFHDCTNTLLI
ncbi:hypothetical protein CAEBREN_23892 [Caenorhabditis brenneri]|uniref:HTH CENPB-type domain-containing protein n=1 Tax=Caenorhabditis brenneri TaxID=135651 RepID=G0MLL4_CAEBE|nr:hypothetical protein CAEBREN_23892 [Caenorhabditis brenneri]